MANLRLDLDTRTKKNGMCPIRLRINSAGTSAYVATGVSVEEQYFIDGSLYDCIHRKAPMAVEKRDKVARLVRQFEEFMTDMDEVELSRMTARDIKERVCGGHVRTHVQAKKATTPSADFMAFFDEFADDLIGPTRSHGELGEPRNHLVAQDIVFRPGGEDGE